MKPLGQVSAFAAYAVKKEKQKKLSVKQSKKKKKQQKWKSGNPSAASVKKIKNKKLQNKKFPSNKGGPQTLQKTKPVNKVSQTKHQKNVNIITLSDNSEEDHGKYSKDSVILPLHGNSRLQSTDFTDSYSDASACFNWMITPVLPDKFFTDIWENKPLLIRRHTEGYYKEVFSTNTFDKILRKNNIQYTKNLDVTSYSDGIRETHNPVGRAYPAVVWDYYNNGCSVRLLNPQTYSSSVWRVCSTLQEYFGTFVGANVYLTPAGTQGFAPHYDDIEAFILQLEGKKHWRLYCPRSAKECLPRTSSTNFQEDEIGVPILDAVLEAGDMLYFPRGTIHQGRSLADAHSLHITLSCFQKNSWGDLLEKVVPAALQAAIEEDLEFREGLPLDYLRYMGIVHCDQESQQRSEFLQKLSRLMAKLVTYAPVDGGVDQMGAAFIHDCLPPVIAPDEPGCSIFTGGERWSDGKVVNRVELNPESYVRLIKGSVLRLVTEGEVVRVYHCLENSRVYHEEEEQFVELTPDHAPAVEALIHAYPSFIQINELPLTTISDKMSIAGGLWDKGLIVTRSANSSEKPGTESSR